MFDVCVLASFDPTYEYCETVEVMKVLLRTDLAKSDPCLFSATSGTTLRPILDYCLYTITTAL